MIVFHRHEIIYRLCLACTCLTLLTVIVNLVHLFRHPHPSNDRPRRQARSAIERLPSNRNEPNDEEDTTRTRSDVFEETYRTVINSFLNAASTHLNHSVNYCPAIPPDLQGPASIDDLPAHFSLSSQSSYHPNVHWGGHSYPSTCWARHELAIIVPYRDRWQILKHFLFHTHTILQRQQLNYRIYVCEQASNKTFNKGIVMNGCFKEILKLQPATPCFIMHDVDLLLIDDRNMYSCPTNPRHLSVAIDKFHFYLPYNELVGGVLGEFRRASLATRYSHPRHVVRRDRRPTNDSFSHLVSAQTAPCRKIDGVLVRANHYSP